VVASEGTEQAAVALPRRLLGLATSAIWLVAAVVVGWYLWPTSLGGCTTLTIVSGRSMEPTYYTGDLVVARCGPVEVGDVVVYTPPDVGGARVIHRIIGGDADGWVIQGDNNDFLDPWEPAEADILGSAVLHVPQLGRLAGILLSPLTWISLLLVALAIVVWPGKDEEDDAAEPAPVGA
jgi:signal peptidase